MYPGRPDRGLTSSASCSSKLRPKDRSTACAVMGTSVTVRYTLAASSLPSPSCSKRSVASMTTVLHMVSLSVGTRLPLKLSLEFRGGT